MSLTRVIEYVVAISSVVPSDHPEIDLNGASVVAVLAPPALTGNSIVFWEHIRGAEYPRVAANGVNLNQSISADQFLVLSIIRARQMRAFTKLIMTTNQEEVAARTFQIIVRPVG